MGYQVQTKLSILIMSEQREEIYHTFALCPLPFYLYPSPPFLIYSASRSRAKRSSASEAMTVRRFGA